MGDIPFSDLLLIREKMTGLFRDRPTNVLKNGPLFARWTTGNQRNHAVFARTLTEFHCNWEGGGALENSYF